MRVLVTGGAGFIGSHTVDALVERGHRVRILDNLDGQAHPDGGVPPHLHRQAEFVRGDVRDADAVRRALQDVDAVCHLAAVLGVGQSMYDIRRFVEANSVGAATILDALANGRHAVRRLVVASSMCLYGEGAYRCEACGPMRVALRSEAQMRAARWEVACPSCGRDATAAPSAEDDPLAPTSVYAVTKRDHEELFLTVGRAYGIPTIALRYFNVYGSRQALSNPYTGAMAIFASRLLEGRPPLLYEDGAQTRDFVHVSDVVQANVLALEHEGGGAQVLNVGTGRAVSLAEAARLLAGRMGVPREPQIPGRYRAGDIRHSVADLTRIQEALGFRPATSFEEGLDGLVDWVRTQTARDALDRAQVELEGRGLLR